MRPRATGAPWTSIPLRACAFGCRIGIPCALLGAVVAAAPAAEQTHLGTGAHVVALSDLDGDGKPEFATAPRGRGRELEIVCADDAKVLWRTEGHDVALLPDQNGDGTADVIVAQPYGRSFEWLALHDGATGERLSTLTPTGEDGTTIVSDGKTRTESVRVLGDVTGDGSPELLVVRAKDAYAALKSTAKWCAGADAFVISLDGKIVADLGAVAHPDSRSPVAAPAGDLDGDGRVDLFVCVESERGYMPLEVRDLDGKTLLRLRGAAKEPPPRIARMCGDLNGDGVPDLALGFPLERRGKKSDVGQLVLRSGKDGRQIRAHKGSDARDRFGAGFVSLPDFDGDGVADYAVGSPGMSTKQSHRGAVIAYSGKTGKVLWTADIGDEGDGFGYALDVLGDIDGDDVADLVAGAPGGFDPRDFGRAVILSGKTGSVRVAHFGERR